jgi:hypothetical protein
MAITLEGTTESPLHDSWIWRFFHNDITFYPKKTLVTLFSALDMAPVSDSFGGFLLFSGSAYIETLARWGQRGLPL